MCKIWRQATCVQAIFILRLIFNSPCTHLSLSPDICAGDHQYMLWVVFRLHTSQPGLRHLRRQPSSYALGGILHAHMSGLYVTDSSLPLRMTEKAFRMTKQGDIRMTSPTNYKAKGIHPDGQIPLIDVARPSARDMTRRQG